VSLDIGIHFASNTSGNYDWNTESK
jgi:hypothetical protein